ncbi:ankyrin domain protein [Stigmatella aurantiaca DW4/3-1]|uniref:Ankyrin domain protein n=1 Tax=Stigmatella aurantiaca (strain DW4/3-1) TaxID=378806 RepID=Q08W74_STIAD|nr:ankyrin domain protein [Stigmatella aurantiaca DW4/3-1]
MMLASYNGRAETARLLLERGADPEQTNDAGQTPLAGAAFKGHVDIATLLLDGGARVDGTGNDGRTALMFAAMFDKLDVLELLLQRGANREQRDADRPRAPLMSQAEHSVDWLGAVNPGRERRIWLAEEPGYPVTPQKKDLGPPCHSLIRTFVANSSVGTATGWAWTCPLCATATGARRCCCFPPREATSSRPSAWGSFSPSRTICSPDGSRSSASTASIPGRG